MTADEINAALRAAFEAGYFDHDVCLNPWSGQRWKAEIEKLIGPLPPRAWLGYNFEHQRGPAGMQIYCPEVRG